MDPVRIDRLLSGRSRGLIARCCRGVLQVAASGYGLAVRLRNDRYQRRPQRVQHVGVPVISVGNITVGGTGKTPLVAWLARYLAARQWQVALVSRGYGTPAGQPNDEARELARLLPDVPHVQNPDRVAAAQQAISRHHAQVIVLDDGFQHRRIHRDLDIVLIDALRPWGYGHLLPRGYLRESLDQLERADLVGVSRADAVSQDRLAEISTQLSRWVHRDRQLMLCHQPSRLINHRGEYASLDSITQRPVAGFCGLGNPAGFRHTLQSSVGSPVGWRAFPDHCAFGPAELESLRAWARRLPSDATLVCTLKDLVKIDLPAIENRQLVAMCIDIQWRRGQDALETQLHRVLPNHGP